MIARLILIVLMLTLATASQARLFFGIYRSSTAAGVPVTGCSNSLDLTQACNSQYLPVIIR